MGKSSFGDAEYEIHLFLFFSWRCWAGSSTYGPGPQGTCMNKGNCRGHVVCGLGLRGQVVCTPGPLRTQICGVDLRTHWCVELDFRKCPNGHC